MVVCISTSSYPRFAGDYAGVFVAELARELVKQRVEVVVLAPGAPGLSDFEILDGVRVYRFSYFWPTQWQLLAYGGGIPSNLRKNPLLCLLFPFFLAGQVKALRYLIRNEKIQLINAHWMLMQGLAAAWIRYTDGVPTVLTMHSAGLQALVRYPFGRRLTDWVVRRMDHIFSVSVAHRSLLCRFLGRDVPIEILPMGVDVDRFDSLRWPKETARRRLGITQGPVLLFLGRLERVKGAKVFIRALKEMSSLRPLRAVVLIAGDGNERASLEEEIRHSDFPERVRFLGQIQRDEVPWILAAADVVCVPSIIERTGVTEGLPVVLLEAMSMGKLVVASKVGGIPDMVNDGVNGFLVEPGNSQAWAQKLADVIRLGDEAIPIGQCARKTAEKFSWESIARRYVEVFRSLETSS